MGTSYVEYKGFGFWTRDSYLESWLTTLMDEMRKLPNPEPWQKSLVEHWEIQVVVGGGCMTVGLDRFLTDDAREEFLLSLAKGALGRTKPLDHRTGELFIDLLEGRLKTIVSSPIDYFD
jgi:hypothetical protein